MGKEKNEQSNDLINNLSHLLVYSSEKPKVVSNLALALISNLIKVTESSPFVQLKLKAQKQSSRGVLRKGVLKNTANLQENNHAEVWFQ